MTLQSALELHKIIHAYTPMPNSLYATLPLAARANHNKKEIQLSNSVYSDQPNWTHSYIIIWLTLAYSTKYHVGLEAYQQCWYHCQEWEAGFTLSWLSTTGFYTLSLLSTTGFYTLSLLSTTGFYTLSWVSTTGFYTLSSLSTAGFLYTVMTFYNRVIYNIYIVMTFYNRVLYIVMTFYNRDHLPGWVYMQHCSALLKRYVLVWVE